MRYSALTLFLAVVGSSSTTSNAFVHPLTSSPKISSTELYIIGPFIRKMREENAQKKMPMASETEREGEAPGLRVGDNAWKWPPVWPYDGDAFTPKQDIKKPAAQASPLGSMLGQAPVVEEVDEEEEEETKFDVMKYWQEEKSDVTTEIDEGASKSIAEHYAFYLKDGMKVLELGAAENSYLPENIKLAQHVGVGANQGLMDKNSALTDSFVVNLNDVTEEQGVNSEDLANLGAESFDAIIMANTVDFLTSPREVFRSAWYLLKPGGIMMVPFVNKDAYKSKFERAQTKWWKDFNDDQHMWVTGSLFQFSAGDGWEGLKGFDISPEGAKKEDGVAGLVNINGGMCAYVVQAKKAEQDEAINPLDPEKSFRSKMWLMPTLEDRDKKLLAPRLSRTYQFLKSEDDVNALAKNVEALPKVYESLIKMDQFAFTFNMQSQLAADLVSDPSFSGNDDQIKALKMGLGLRTPSKEFWELVGQRTASMVPEDKINLLAHIVPRFGSNDPAQEKALEDFVSGLEPTFDTIRTKCSALSEADVQLVGTELLAAEILKPGRSTKKEFASWVAALSEDEISELLEKRKSFKKVATDALEEMRTERQAEIDKQEAEKQKFKDQLEKAREERTIALNYKTGKMELVED